MKAKLSMEKVIILRYLYIILPEKNTLLNIRLIKRYGYVRINKSYEYYVFGISISKWMVPEKFTN